MNFKEFLKQGERLNLDDKEQVKTEELVDQVITITNATIARGDKGNYAICLYKENDKKFFFAPSILTNLIEEIMKNNEAMMAMHNGDFKVKLTKRLNKDHTRSYFNVEVM